MATQLEELRATPVEMLREMRRNPGVYSRALIAQTVAEKESQEPASQFGEDYRSLKRGLTPIVRGAEQWMRQGQDATGRRDALNKMRQSLPASGPLSYFTAAAPERQQSGAIRSFLDKNSAALINDPEQFNAFVSDPAGYVQMQGKVMTPRETPREAPPAAPREQLAPAVNAAAGEASPDVAATMGEPGPESIPAPYLPPLMAAAGGLPPGFNGTMPQGNVPPWLRPKAPNGGAVGEGGGTAGGRPVRPMAPVPPQNPAMAAITAGQQAASETAAPAVAAAASGPDAAGVAEMEGAMSPALKQATDDYLKLLNAQENTDDQDKFLSLAKAGFTMAASGSPYLLQAVGQGGNAGIDAYQAARAKAAERRLRSASGTLDVAKIGEDVRRNTLTDKRENRRITEAERSAQAAEDDRGVGRDLQREGIDIQRYLAERPEYSFLGQDDDGKAILYDRRSGDTVTGPKVATVGKGGQSVFSQKLQAFRAAGYAEAEALERASGTRRSTAAENIRAATMAAKAKSANVMNPKEADKVYRETYDEVLGVLQDATATAPAAAAPTTRAPAADPLGLFAQ